MLDEFNDQTTQICEMKTTQELALFYSHTNEK